MEKAVSLLMMIPGILWRCLSAGVDGQKDQQAFSWILIGCGTQTQQKTLGVSFFIAATTTTRTNNNTTAIVVAVLALIAFISSVFFLVQI